MGNYDEALVYSQKLNNYSKTFRLIHKKEVKLADKASEQIEEAIRKAEIYDTIKGVYYE